MKRIIDEKAIIAAEEIIKRGNNAVIRKNKDGVIVLEEIRKTKYRAGSIEIR